MDIPRTYRPVKGPPAKISSFVQLVMVAAAEQFVAPLFLTAALCGSLVGLAGYPATEQGAGGGALIDGLLGGWKGAAIGGAAGALDGFRRWRHEGQRRREEGPLIYHPPIDD